MIIDPHNVLKSSGDVLALPGSAGQLIADMDRAGVDLSGAYCYDNAVTAEAVNRHPERIFGMAWAVPSNPGAVEIVDRALNEWKFKGLKFNGPKSLAAMRPNGVMNEIFSLLVERDAVLLAHSTEGDHIFSMPYQFEQVARAFPRLKIIMAHIGAPDDIEDAIRVATWNENVYLSSHAAPGPVIRLAAQRAGAHKVMLGADWPYEDFEVEITKIKAAIPDAAERELVLGGNAQRLFNFG